MVPFRGRLLFKQYIPGKSHKYGIKLFKLCDPDGFTYNLRVYSGKSLQNDTKNQRLSRLIVRNLVEPYLDKERTLVTNNYYTSYELCKNLKKRKTHLIGTLRKDHKNIPKAVLKKNLKRGETIAQYSGPICIKKWKDKRDVLTLSSKNALKFRSVGTEWHTEVEKHKPEVILEYNTIKMGIDLSDQMSSYYSLLCKRIR